MFLPPLRLLPRQEREDIIVERNEPLVPYCVNIVLTCSLNTPFSLRRLVRKLPFLEFNPLSFASAIGHFEAPQITYRVSSSGMMVIAGGQNLYTAQYTAKRFIELIRDEYPQARMTDRHVQNLTCTVIMGYKIDIVRCTQEHAERCVYHAESFPGMHVKTGVGTIMHIVFFTGKIVITGARNAEQAHASLRAVEPLLRRYALPLDTPPPPAVKRSKRRKTAEPVTEEAIVDQIVDEEIESLIRSYG